MHAIPFTFGFDLQAPHTCVLQGRVLLSKLTADDTWTKVYGVSRRPLHFEHKRLQHIALDLKNKNKVTESLKSEKVSGVTHVFHTAFAGDMTNTDRGVAHMLDHLIDGLEANGESLQHVYFTTGLKYYGEQYSVPRVKLWTTGCSCDAFLCMLWLRCHCPLLFILHYSFYFRFIQHAQHPTVKVPSLPACAKHYASSRYALRRSQGSISRD